MSEKRNAPLGIFDSGVGGLTVVREILKQMPGESIIYFGDTAHVPYGDRDPQELRGFAQKITNYLVTRGCKMIIIACNTSTSLAYEELTNSFSLPIIGVIEPGVNKALMTTKNLRVGVIGTAATIESRVYQRKLRAKNPDVQVYAQACPAFVPLVERGALRSAETADIVSGCLHPFMEKEIDTLILGCTHYPFLQPVIAKVLGAKTQIIDPAQETVRCAYERLQELDLLVDTAKPVYKFVSSNNPKEFRAKGSVFLGRDLGTVEEVLL
ncbi:MAG: glutamate racemase [Peptococcia bacterium]|jgi:glutamate racemase